MGNLERFNLSWDGFEANIKDALRELIDAREFSDVTLVAGDGKQVKANKVMLASGSSFFFNILRENPHPHPLIYLKGVSHHQLLSLLDFLYTGEASIVQEDLNEFMDIAEDLKVKGLTPTGSQTKSNPSTSDPLQSQGVAEEPGTSPRVSYPQSATSTTASLQTSAYIESQLTAAGSDTTPLMSRPLNVISTLQGEPATEDSRPPSMASSDRDNTRFSQDTRKENHVGINTVKVEMDDAEHYNISYGMNDHGKVSIRGLREEDGNIGCNGNVSNPQVLGGYFVNIPQDICQGMGLSVKQEQNDPEEEVTECSDDFNYDWYKRGEEINTMRPDEPEIEDSNGDMDATKVVDNVSNEQSTHACDKLSKENCKDMIPDAKQDRPINRKKCDICAKTFPTLYKLQKHKMSHNGEKFHCLVCFKKFINASSLNLHEKIHTGEKFQCLICFKQFSRKETLKQHEGMHTGENPYPCLQCSKKFARQSRLDAHMMIHNGEQPYQCLVCFKKFSQLGNLKSHEKVHTGNTVEKKPYQCMVCSKQFCYESSFQKHKKIHTNEKH